MLERSTNDWAAQDGCQRTPPHLSRADLPRNFETDPLPKVGDKQQRRTGVELAP